MCWRQAYPTAPSGSGRGRRHRVLVATPAVSRPRDFTQPCSPAHPTALFPAGLAAAGRAGFLNATIGTGWGDRSVRGCNVVCGWGRTARRRSGVDRNGACSGPVRDGAAGGKPAPRVAQPALAGGAGGWAVGACAPGTGAGASPEGSGGGLAGAAGACPFAKGGAGGTLPACGAGPPGGAGGGAPAAWGAVSYTHLTLPTILLV